MSDASPKDEAQLRKSPIEKIEEAIIECLDTAGLNVKYVIAAFPDNPDAFDLGKAEKVALVQYTGSRYAAPEGSRTAQMRSPEFAIHLYLRSVGKPLRAPYEIDQIRLAIQDRTVQGTKLYVTRDGLVDQDGPLWRYLIEVACSPIPAPARVQSRPSPFVTDFSKSEGA